MLFWSPLTSITKQIFLFCSWQLYRIVIFGWTVPLRSCFFFSHPPSASFFICLFYQFFILLDLDFLFCLRLLKWISQRFRLSLWLLLSVFSVLITADTDVLIRLRNRGPWSHCYCNNYSTLPQSNNPWTPEEFSNTLTQENSPGTHVQPLAIAARRFGTRVRVETGGILRLT